MRRVAGLLCVAVLLWADEAPPTPIETEPGQDAAAALGRAGLFGNRGTHLRRLATSHYGGNQASVVAVQQALRWLKRHQGQNGGWDVSTFWNNCQDLPKCEPGAIQPGHATALTGLAVLGFLGAGCDQRLPSPFTATVRRGLDFLIAAQDAEGSFGRNFEQGICTSALVEAWAMTKDDALLPAVRLGLANIQRRQTQDPNDPQTPVVRLAWDYLRPNPGRTDAALSGWNLLALRSAVACGLLPDADLAGLRRWLQHAWEATNPEWAKLDPATGESRFPYLYNVTSGRVLIAADPASQDHDLTTVGLSAGVFLGYPVADRLLTTQANHILAHQQPSTWPLNTYRLYFATMGLFQLGGERWTTWNRQVLLGLVVPAQRNDAGCLGGSWDWEGQKWQGADTGRLLSTCLCLLSLEAYYRYARLSEPPQPLPAGLGP